MGISEKTILGFFHKDAWDLWNVTSNLRAVCEKLKDPNFRMTSLDEVLNVLVECTYNI